MKIKLLSSLILIVSASASASQMNSDEMFDYVKADSTDIVLLEKNEQLAKDMIDTVELASKLMASKRPTAKMQASVVLNDYINTSKYLFTPVGRYSNQNLAQDCQLSLLAARSNMNNGVNTLITYASDVVGKTIPQNVIGYHYTNVALQTLMGAAVTALAADSIAMTVGSCNEQSLQAMEYLTLINSIANSVHAITSPPVLNNI